LWLHKTTKPHVVWLAALAIGVTLSWVLFRQGQRPLIKEVPYIADFLAGLVPPPVIAGLVVAIGRRAHPVVVVTLGAVVFVVTYFGAALVGAYVLGDLL
jgi:hypothetical protein